METQSVGIREFRTDMAQYINARSPVAITRHSQTVGYFIPTLRPTKRDLTALKEASAKLDKLLADEGIDVEDLVADFKAARRAGYLAAQREPLAKTVSKHKLPIVQRSKELVTA